MRELNKYGQAGLGQSDEQRDQLIMKNWGGGRSLRFDGRQGPKPYDAIVDVFGAVTGIRFGTMLLTIDDLHELRGLVASLLGSEAKR